MRTLNFGGLRAIIIHDPHCNTIRIQIHNLRGLKPDNLHLMLSLAFQYMNIISNKSSYYFIESIISEIQQCPPLTHGFSSSRSTTILTYQDSNSLMLRRSAYNPHLTSSHHAVTIISHHHKQQLGECSTVRCFREATHS